MRQKLVGWLVSGALCAGLGASLAQAAEGTCAPALARSEVGRFRERIAAAPDVGAARALALQPTRGARLALAQARRIVPWATALRSAEGRLATYESAVNAAPSQERVADEFAALMWVPRSRGAMHADFGGSACDYSTGEMVAIVIGFVLGILPGVILMFLLC